MADQRILLVEGNDDKHVLRTICDTQGVPRPDTIRPHGGIQKLLPAITPQLQASTGQGDIIGIVADADDDLNARWQSIHHRLREAGYNSLPVSPDPYGTILQPPVDSPLPRAGVWIWPDNREAGILENFLRFLVPQPNSLLDYATSCVDAIPSPLFSVNDKPKAVIHTWLAWQSDPGRQYGTAIKARFLDPTLHEATVLVAWLRRLFQQSGDTR